MNEKRNILYPTAQTLLARVYLQKGKVTSALDLLRNLHGKLVAAQVAFPLATALNAVAVLRAGQLRLLDELDLTVLPERLVALIRTEAAAIRQNRRPVDDAAILAIISAEQREMRLILVGLGAKRTRAKVACARSAGWRIEGG